MPIKKTATQYLKDRKKWVELLVEGKADDNDDPRGKDYNLIEADLEGVFLPYSCLNKTDLMGANLIKANLKGADIQHANLYEAELVGADLSKADLFGTNLKSANLRFANLRGAEFGNADLRHAQVEGAKTEGATFFGVIISSDTLEVWKAILTPHQLEDMIVEG